MSQHEPMNAPGDDPTESGDGRSLDAEPVQADEGSAPATQDAPEAPPRDLAQRVWGGVPERPAGTAPAPPLPRPAPAVVGPEAPLPPDPEFDVEAEEEDALVRLEDRLAATEERLGHLTDSVTQSLATLGDSIRTATADLPAVIERVLERRLSGVGDALTRLAELRATLQEETAEAVRGLTVSFRALEERLGSIAVERLEASSTAIAARVAELPTRGDLASVRGSLDTIASTLEQRLGEAIERIERIEAALVEGSTPSEPAGAEATAEPERAEPAYPPPPQEFFPGPESFVFPPRSEP